VSAPADPTFDAVAAGLGSAALTALKDTLSASWESFTDDERKQAMQLMITLARARLHEIAGQDVSSFLPILQAALLQWQVVGKQVLVDGVRAAATEAFGLGGAFAGGLLGTALKGAL